MEARIAPKKLIMLDSQSEGQIHINIIIGHIAMLMAPAMPHNQVISDLVHIEHVVSPMVMAAVIVAAIAIIKGLKNAVKQATMRDQNIVNTANKT